MKALRFECLRGCYNDEEDNGMSVYENQGDMVFDANTGYFEDQEHTTIYLSRDNVKELVAYLSDWLANNG